MGSQLKSGVSEKLMTSTLYILFSPKDIASASFAVVVVSEFPVILANGLTNSDEIPDKDVISYFFLSSSACLLYSSCLNASTFLPKSSKGFISISHSPIIHSYPTPEYTFFLT